VESLQSHCIHTMSHWSSLLSVCFLSWGTRGGGGLLLWNRILLLALSRYTIFNNAAIKILYYYVFTALPPIATRLLCTSALAWEEGGAST
jgi:hypothetical protein